MKFDVGLARALILIANLAILGLFGTVSWGFFVGKPDELDMRLPDETRYAKREAKNTKDSGRAKEVIALLFAEKPKENKPVKIDKPVVVDKQPVGGPLKDWKILNVITYPTCSMAIVFKGEDPEESSASPAARSGSSRARRGSRSARRRPSSRGGKTKFESMIEGQGFKDYEVVIESITKEKVEYRHTSSNKLYTIVRENYEVQDYSAGLEGQEIDDDQLAPRSKAPEVDPEDQGRINKGSMEDKSKSSKKKSKSSKSNRKTPKDD